MIKSTKQNILLHPKTDIGSLNIPDDWENSKIDKLFKFVKGKVPETLSDFQKNEMLPYLSSDYLAGKEKEFAPIKNGVYVSKEDIILIADGDGSGRTYSNVEGILSSTFLLLKPKKKIIKDFIFHFLQLKYPLFQATKYGTSIPHVDKFILKKLPIPIPSEPEQKKISTIINNLNSGIFDLEENIHQLRELKRGITRKLILGHMSKSKPKKIKWYFGKTLEIPEHWNVFSVKELAKKEKGSFSMGPFGSDIKRENFVPKGIPVIRGVNMKGNYFNENGFVFLTTEKADELSYANAKRGDLLLTHRGTLGQVGLIPHDSKFERYIISQSQMKCSLDPKKANVYYLYFYLKTSIGQSLLLMNSTKMGVPHIIQPLSTLRDLPVILPPVDEQDEICSIIKNMDSFIDCRIKYVGKLKKIRQSLMQKLLTGEVRVKV